MKKISEVFNPSKITISGKSKIIDTSEGRFVLKKKNKDIKSLYDYLNSRSFNSFPELVDELDDEYVYKALSEPSVPIEQKSTDMAKLLANLHTKTAYFKDVSQDKIKEIYENIVSNISHIDSYYETLFNNLEIKDVLLPSELVLLEGRSKMKSLIEFLSNEAETWYKLVSDKTKERVVYCHNNLSIDHYINNSFISWDNYTVDTPVLDLINLYHNDFGKYNYSNFLDKYLKLFDLLDEEKHLLFLMISFPIPLNMGSNEMNNTINASKLFDYINETENLIRPYYTVENEE
ncbi:MAG: hypothetical protein Q4C33_01995 [bacterium]|nr:hypothetical protein [bacterium]